jgi:putative transposase
VRRYHRAHGSSGHVWQGRFKAFPIQQDEHLLTVLRDVERNALRAKLLRRAERWPRGRFYHYRDANRAAFLDAGPAAVAVQLNCSRQWRGNTPGA